MRRSKRSAPARRSSPSRSLAQDGLVLVVHLRRHPCSLRRTRPLRPRAVLGGQGRLLRLPRQERRTGPRPGGRQVRKGGHRVQEGLRRQLGASPFALDACSLFSLISSRGPRRRGRLFRGCDGDGGSRERITAARKTGSSSRTCRSFPPRTLADLAITRPAGRVLQQTPRPPAPARPHGAQGGRAGRSAGGREAVIRPRSCRGDRGTGASASLFCSSRRC